MSQHLQLQTVTPPVEKLNYSPAKLQLKTVKKKRLRLKTKVAPRAIIKPRVKEAVRYVKDEACFCVVDRNDNDRVLRKLPVGTLIEDVEFSVTEMGHGCSTSFTGYASGYVNENPGPVSYRWGGLNFDSYFGDGFSIDGRNTSTAAALKIGEGRHACACRYPTQ